MRALNMQALTNDTQARCLGVVIYGVGDDDHKTRISDHNEDDTPGSKAAQSDKDNVPEHRAIDVMLGAAFTAAQADQYVADLLADPAALVRLKYIIWNRHIWEKSNGWKRRDYTGDDPHTNHVHVSGDVADDENGSSWPAVQEGSGDMFCKYGDKGDKVNALQREIVACGGQVGEINGQPDYDSNYGNNTASGLKGILGYGDGKTFGPKEYVDLLIKLAKKYAGVKGDKGDDGDDGKDGEKGDKGDAAVIGVGTFLLVSELPENVSITLGSGGSGGGAH